MDGDKMFGYDKEQETEMEPLISVLRSSGNTIIFKYTKDH